MADDAAEQIKALKGQLTRYGLLSEAMLVIAETPDLDRLLNGAINKLKWVVDFERCTLALINEDGASFDQVPKPLEIVIMRREKIGQSQGGYGLCKLRGLKLKSPDHKPAFGSVDFSPDY